MKEFAESEQVQNAKKNLGEFAKVAGENIGEFAKNAGEKISDALDGEDDKKDAKKK